MATREEEIKVKVTGAREGERDLDKLGDAAKDVGKSVTGMGRDADKAADKVDDLGDEAKGTASELSRLDRRIAATRLELKKLNDEFERTGDDATLKKLQKQHGELSRLESTAKRVANLGKTLAGAAGTAVSAGGSAVSAGGSALSGLAGAGGPIGTALTVGVGGAAAVGGAFTGLAAGSGALLAGGGIGAVAGGLAGAAMGPRGDELAGEWNSVLDGLKDSFFDATTSWVDPAKDAVRDLGDTFESLPIEGVFEDAEKYIEPLTKGLTGFLQGAANGLDDLVKSAEPVVDRLGEELPELGSDFGDAMQILSGGADGAADAFGDLLDVIGGVAKGIATTAAGAGVLWEKAVNTPVLREGHELFMGLFDFGDMPDAAARKLGDVADSSYNAAEAADKLKESVKSLNETFDASFDVATGQIEANLAFEESLDNLTEGWNRQKNALDATTEKGRENIQLAVDYVEAAKEQRDAAIAAGDGSREATAKANAAYEAQIQKLEGILVKLGVSKEEAHKFAQQFLGLDGMTVDTYIRVNYRTNGTPGPAGSRYGGVDMHAEGGTMTSTGVKLVGEKGPELIWGSQGQYVSTAQQTQRLLSGMSAGSGATAKGGTFVVAAGADSFVGQLFQRLIDAGYIQAFAGGQPVTTRP